MNKTLSYFELYQHKFNQMKKALISDFVHNHLISELGSMGYHVDYEPKISLEEVAEKIANYEGIVINSKIKMYQPLIDKAKRLKWIARLGSGMEIIDQEYASQKNIAAINSPEGNCNAVAEHALGMLLALSNNLIRSDKQVRTMQWNREQNRGFEITGKKIGVIGYGHTGSSFVSKVSSWELDVLIYDKYKDLNFKSSNNLHAVDKEDILNEADIISLHLPYTSETHHYVDEDFIQKCNRKPVIINTSRGAIVKTQALIKGLQDGYLGGACLDVFENEKTNTYTADEHKMYAALFQLPNVVLSTHVAGWTRESLYKIADTIVQKLKRIEA